MKKKLLLIIMFLLICMSIFAGGQPEGPAKTTQASGCPEAAACISCHTDIYENFKGSEHASSLTGIPVGSCASCHSCEATVQASPQMKAAGVTCIDCHMPTVPGTAGTFRSHGPANDPKAGLEASCTSCHSPQGGASVLSGRKLAARAAGYHQESGKK